MLPKNQTFPDILFQSPHLSMPSDAARAGGGAERPPRTCFPRESRQVPSQPRPHSLPPLRGCSPQPGPRTTWTCSTLSHSVQVLELAADYRAVTSFISKHGSGGEESMYLEAVGLQIRSPNQGMMCSLFRYVTGLTRLFNLT